MSDLKKVRLTDSTLHWYKTGDRRSKVHIYQYPNPIDPKLTHSKTFCGTIYVSTGIFSIPRDVHIADMCLICFHQLQTDHTNTFEEV